MLRIGQQDLSDLSDVGFGVLVDFFAGKLRAGLIAAGGIANAGCVVADDQDRLMAPFLKLPDHAQGDGMTEGDVRRGWIHPELDPQWLAGLLMPQKFLAKSCSERIRSHRRPQKANLFVDVGRHKGAEF